MIQGPSPADRSPAARAAVGASACEGLTNLDVDVDVVVIVAVDVVVVESKSGSMSKRADEYRSAENDQRPALPCHSLWTPAAEQRASRSHFG